MKELDEQGVCVKFCCKVGKKFTGTFHLLNQIYREDCMSRTECSEWFKRFKEGRISVGEDPRLRRPSTSINDDNVKRGSAVIRGNRRLTVREVADEVGISVGSCHEVFTGKLEMRRVSAKFVPRLLTEDQKESRVEISHELLANANGNENCLKNIITGDETWVNGYDVETKKQPSQWMGKGSPRPKKARLIPSKIKVMLVVFFDWKGTVHHEFVPRSQMVNRQMYQEVLARLRVAVRRKRPELWENQTLDVAPRQSAGSRVAPHPQLSGKTSDIRCAPSTLFSGLSPSRLFPVSQT